MKHPALQKVLKRIGGASALAKKLRISQPSVSGWKRVPATRVLAVERISGVSRHELRPDIYGRKPR